MGIKNLAKCKLCRREGEKLFLKGDRCTTQKCAVIRRNFPPGIHGAEKKPRMSQYGKQMREKQKAKRIYGLRERQFRKYFDQAMVTKGITGNVLIALLETRLDNVVYRLGVTKSRPSAKQLVGYGHIMVNGRKVTIPSYQAKIGDEISIRKNDLKKPFFKDIAKTIKKEGVPIWLSLEVKGDNILGKVLAMPTLKDIDQSVDTHTIVEFYSR